jgi:NAD dependent epimerase/dehydratase
VGKEKAMGDLEKYRGLMSKKVLVSGAGGFVGSHLTEELVRIGAQVKAFVHYNSRNDWGLLEFLPEDNLREIDVVAGDVCDPFSVRNAIRGCDVVFHLAALIGIPYSYSAPQSYTAVNAQGTLNVLQASLDEGVEKVVHTSTSEVYGTAQYVPIDEKHPLNPQSPYAASKVAADQLASSYHLSFDLPVATLRPFNIFGPRQSARAVIPSIICQAVEDSVVKIGSVEAVRDFTYVKDAVSGFLAVACSDAAVGTTMNIGTGEGISIDRLVESVSKVMGKKLSVQAEQERIRPEKSEVWELICDYSKARDIMQWAPSYLMEEGLEETVAWIQANLNRYKVDVYNI